MPDRPSERRIGWWRSIASVVPSWPTKRILTTCFRVSECSNNKGRSGQNAGERCCGIGQTYSSGVLWSLVPSPESDRRMDGGDRSQLSVIMLHLLPSRWRWWHQPWDLSQKGMQCSQLLRHVFPDSCSPRFLSIAPCWVEFTNSRHTALASLLLPWSSLEYFPWCQKRLTGEGFAFFGILLIS